MWNSKSYLSRPLLTAEDHLVLKHRRWYAQFYTRGDQGKKEKASLDW